MNDADVSMGLRSDVAVWLDVVLAGAEEEMRVGVGVVPMSDGVEPSMAVVGGGPDGVDDVGMVVGPASMAEDVD